VDCFSQLGCNELVCNELGCTDGWCSHETPTDFMKMRIGVVAGDVQMSTQLQITQLLTVMRRVEQLCLFLKHHGIQDLASNTYE